MTFTRFDQINWTLWQPVDRATLLFVIEGDEVLLMLKKRGLGAGKVNAPGGRLEAGEEPCQGAIREVEEELRVTPLAPKKHGELSFQFTNNYSIFVHVFAAASHRGTAQETEEASPRWTHKRSIPYDQMWADDALWVPILLKGGYFSGRFLFDDERMLGYDLTEIADRGGAPW